MLRVVLILLLAVAGPAAAQLRLEITDGVFEPQPVAVPAFIDEGNAGGIGFEIARVIETDLASTGLFRALPASAYITQPTSFDAPVQFPDWRAVNAEVLVLGAVSVQGGQMQVKYRVFDTVTGQELGRGEAFTAPVSLWRRIAHKVADAAYSRITGEGRYFDSTVAYVSETGPKDARRKAIALMDHDGANQRELTDGHDIVIAPRFDRDGRRIIYTSIADQRASIQLIDVDTLAKQQVPTQAGTMAFSPRFSPDGGSVIYSLSNAGATDIWRSDLASGQHSRLTATPAIDTAPSFSPDGRQIVFESDRSGRQQLYIMDASGGEARRISAGQGRYGTPVWSPRGDLIAFTHQAGGEFHIGVMRIDGSEERLLTASRLDEGPTWSPNGRVIMFTREGAGADGRATLMSVDITGRNLRKVPLPGAGSDPTWGPLRP